MPKASDNSLPSKPPRWGNLPNLLNWFSDILFFLFFWVSHLLFPKLEAVIEGFIGEMWNRGDNVVWAQNSSTVL